MTRSCYDPIPSSNKDIKRIDIRNEDPITPADTIAKGDLFLYIPITQDEVKNNQYEIPIQIQKFLKSIELNVDFKITEANQHSKIMIIDTTYNKSLLSD